MTAVSLAHASPRSLSRRVALPGTLARAPLEAAFPLHVTVGPFRVVVVHAPRERMRARRRLMEYELSQGVVWLHESLTGERLAYQFLNAVVRLIHKSAGCQTGCIEEAFTQSLAAGLVSFAQHNREAWIWFNRLLAEALKPGARFEQAASGAFRVRLTVPKVALVEHHVVRFAPLSHDTAVRHSVDGYFRTSKDGRFVELYECLHGPQRAVVFVHEVTHAIHDAAHLRVRDTRERYVSAQVAGWLRFIRRNPGAWMWLLATIREQYDFEPLALLT